MSGVADGVEDAAIAGRVGGRDDVEVGSSETGKCFAKENVVLLAGAATAWRFCEPEFSTELDLFCLPFCVARKSATVLIKSAFSVSSFLTLLSKWESRTSTAKLERLR